MKMTFDHFDTQVSHEETQACQDWNGYLEMLDSFDNETKAELNEVDMQCEKAEAEAVAAGYPPTL
jgi:hypothetical protein